MKILTFRKEKIESMLEVKYNTVLISIVSTAETPILDNIKKLYDDVLELRFDDLPYDPTKIPEAKEIFKGMRVFDKTDYDKISEFVNKYPNKDIYIHCGAGVSRSPAVAIGISFLRNDLNLFQQIINDNQPMSPNEIILSYFRIFANPHRGGLNLSNFYYRNRLEKIDSIDWKDLS